MTKIEAFQAASGVAKRVSETLSRALGRDSSSNDKHRLYVQYSSMQTHDSFPGAQLVLHGSYGYYGNSSGYRAMDPEVAGYMVKAINAHISMLADHAVKLAGIDAEKARKAAEAEAREVLAETAAQ